MTNQAQQTGGRSLRKSVSVGLILGGTFLASILIVKELFIVLAAVAVAAGAWELSTALRAPRSAGSAGWYVPRVPSVVGSIMLMPAVYFGGAQ